jgi:hypothetical protein
MIWSMKKNLTRQVNVPVFLDENKGLSQSTAWNHSRRDIAPAYPQITAKYFGLVIRSIETRSGTDLGRCRISVGGPEDFNIAPLPHVIHANKMIIHSSIL